MDTLERFVQAQQRDYPIALAEIRRGRKTSHWMWYIFPQLRGLGRSEMAWTYGIQSREEAEAYLAHPILGPRLTEICQVLLTHKDKTAEEIFGWIDAKKLRSCATLFAQVSPPDSVFHQVLEQFCSSTPDRITLSRL